MKLAYDVTSAVKPEPTGTARYAVELLRAILRRLEPRDEVVLGYRLSRWGRRAHAPRFDDPRVALRPLQSPFAFLTYGRPDLFHGLGVSVPRGLGRCPSFVTLHGVVPAEAVGADRVEKLDRRHAKIRAMLDRATRAFVVSAFEKQRTIDATGCAAEKLVVVPHGVDHTRFRANVDAAADRAELGVVAPSRPFLLYVGAITDLKNVGALLEAFARSRARRDCALVLLGPHRRESEPILARIAALGLDRDVIAPGHARPEAVPSWLRLARALVHPSRYESFGLPVLEAMACGAPVACSNVAALPEVAGDAAHFFDPSSVDAITAALDAIAFDETLRSRLRAAGLARAASFTWDESARRTMAAYAALIGAK